MTSKTKYVTISDMMTLSPNGTELTCSGSWVLSGLPALDADLKRLGKRLKQVTRIDLRAIEKMDTAGALFLNDLLDEARLAGHDLHIAGLSGQLQSLFSLVSKKSKQVHEKIERPKVTPNFFAIIGRLACNKYWQFGDFFAFFGELSIILFQLILHPSRIRWRATFKLVDETGYHALPIVALMSFLIGIVLAYQLTTELATYGVTIFVVNISGIAIFREFGPLITAIIIAGRTSTAFSALIGTMKVNEEIDALSAMGVVPMERLVVPRIFGLMIALPLLTVWADGFGVLGSMLMSKMMSNISYTSFLQQFKQAVAVRHLMLGLVKTPVFALIISSVGCFQGFRTGTSAESVGWQTTKSAVQAIFFIIVVDATFSILFSMMGL